jgi:predicted porin
MTERRKLLLVCVAFAGCLGSGSARAQTDYSVFNALGNSPSFSPAIRHVFGSGNLEGIQGDFYWDRAASYVSPAWSGLTASVMYAQGPSERRGDYAAASVVYSRGLFAATVSLQKVRFNQGFDDPTSETTAQLGATYNFGLVRVFGLYTQTDDRGLDVRSRIASAGFIVPVGPGSIQVQAATTPTRGPAVDRRHTTASAAYLYAWNSKTDLYLVGMDDRIRGQTRGTSFATGVRLRF